MKTLILLLIPLNLFAQIWSDTIPDWDHNNIANIHIEYIGDWVHMKPDGSYPNADNCKAIYRGWLHGIDVYTEEFSNHNYFDISIDGNTERVMIDKTANKANSLTYSNHDLEYGNHVIEFSAPRYSFVLNSLIKYVDSSPHEPDSIPIEPCVSDTIMIEVFVYVYDTTYLYDTIYLEPRYFIKADSLYFEIK